MPKPYEYALMSQAIYLDDLCVVGGEGAIPEQQRVLEEKGWQFVAFIRHESGYIGGIWVNDTEEQMVIAHRGSQNATSWVTDIESVVQCKPGYFTGEAIGSLAHAKVLEYRQRGYRLSTTGHSLGGFLAQVCVFWSQRSEFEATYYPEMSAMVFDSPGAEDFLEVLQTNLGRERLDLKRLNIHNFCGMPTVVSTFGGQLGTIWHLTGSEEVKFDFVNAHKMEHIVAGFDASPGLPKDFRQMHDWPAANYSQFASFSQAATSILHATLKAPFDILNGIYQRIKVLRGLPHTATHYEQIFQTQGQIQYYLQQTAEQGHRPDAATLTEKINLAIHGHYLPLSREVSMKQVDLCHFAKDEQRVLEEIEAGRKAHPDLGWSTALEKQYTEQGLALLHAFKLEQKNERIKVVLRPEYQGTFFAFQEDLSTLIQQHGLISFERFITDTLQQTRSKLTQVQSELSALPQSLIEMRQLAKEKEETLQKKIAGLEKAVQALQVSSTPPNSNASSLNSTISIRTAIALAEAGIALRPLSQEDFDKESERIQHLITVMKDLKPGQSLEMDCARSTKRGGVAMVGTPESMAALHRYGVLGALQGMQQSANVREVVRGQPFPQ